MSGFLSNWVTQLRKGTLEFLVLRALQDEDLYGYDIVKKLGVLEELMISEGTIYPLLSRLRKQGLLTTYLQESQQGPARKYYQLTRAGRTMLKDMNRIWTGMTEGLAEIDGQSEEDR